MQYILNGMMKAKANALLLCTLMIASALAGCAGEDVERTLTQADCDAIGDGYKLDLSLIHI